MNKNSLLMLALATAALSACGPREESPEVRRTPSVSEPQATSPAPAARFSLVLVQNFRDSGAYNGYRSVYVLKDSTTGQEFVGVSGIGISELGAHQSGKTRVTDER